MIGRASMGNPWFIKQCVEYIENNNTIVDASEANKIYEEEEFEIIQALESASSYNDFINKWANNGGELRKSKNVLNVLLVGVDGDDGLENGGRSDSIILVSLNKKTQKIYMTSFFRDTWTYMNIGGSDRYNKLNASFFHGGDDALIDTIEKNFKIDIDYYVAVDFSSFTDIINALGGVTLEVEEYEANLASVLPEISGFGHILGGHETRPQGMEPAQAARMLEDVRNVLAGKVTPVVTPKPMGGEGTVNVYYFDTWLLWAR